MEELKILPIQFSRFGSVFLGSTNQHGDTNFFFSRLDPFLVLSSELLRASSVDMEKIFRLTGCSVARGSRGIQILGSARGGGGRSNRVGLGRAASISAPPFSPRIARATVVGFDRIARAFKSVTRK